MARIRTIKPEFFTSEDIVFLTPLSRLFYIALWCEADREGRFRWKAQTLKFRYLPGDDCDIQDVAEELIDAGLIVIYEVDGEEYCEIPSFVRHQVINNREKDSDLPSRERGTVTRPSRVKAEGRKEGKEGKGTGASKNDAPVEAIVDLYHEVLPELPKVVVLNETRRRQIRARWNTSDKTKSLDWWRQYFVHVRNQDFLMGETEKGFKADLEFLTRESKFSRVIENFYGKGERE